MESIREQLTTAYQNKDVQALFDAMTKTSDLKVFKANVMQNKDKILALCKSEPPQPTPPQLPPPQAPQALPQQSVQPPPPAQLPTPQGQLPKQPN